MLQCAVFSIPSFIWSFFVSLNGFNLKHVIKNVLKSAYLKEYSEKEGWQSTQKAVETITEQITMSFLKQKSSMPKKLNFSKIFTDKLSTEEKARNRRQNPNLKIKSNFPMFLPYLLVKIIYLTNLASHFFLIGFIFGINYFEFAIYSLKNFLFYKYQFINKYFPKRSLCDVVFYQKFSENQMTVVCSLPLNLFNEMFYFGFFFWLIITGVFSIISLCYWCVFFSKAFRRRFVLRALQLSEDEQKIKGSYTAICYLSEEVSVEAVDNFLIEHTGYSLMGNFDLFFQDVCSIDLLFLIKIISINSTPLAARDILNILWDRYLNLEDLKLREPRTRPIVTLKRKTSKHELNGIEV